MKKLLQISAVELGDELFKIHTHAEIVYNQNPDQVVYREKDIVALLKKLGFTEPDFNSSIIERLNKKE